MLSQILRPVTNCIMIIIFVHRRWWLNGAKPSHDEHEHRNLAKSAHCTWYTQTMYIEIAINISNELMNTEMPKCFFNKSLNAAIDWSFYLLNL